MTLDRFWELLSKKNCGEASVAEIKEFEDITIAHPEWKNTADALSNFNFQPTVPEENNEAELAFETHLNRMKRADVKFNSVESHAAEMGISKSTGRSRKWLISVGVVGAIL